MLGVGGEGFWSMEEGEWPFPGSGDKQRTNHSRGRRHTGEGPLGGRNHLCKRMTFSEAQDDEKKSEGKWNLVLILAKNCSWSLISFMELIIRECNISNVSACVWGLV